MKASRNKQDLTPRAQRWWAFLQSFTFDIQYRDGKRMAHVDFLSRNPISPGTTFAPKVLEEKRVNLAEISSNWLIAEQRREPDIAKIVTKLKDFSLDEDIAKTYELRTEVPHRKIQRNGRTRCLPVVPRASRWSVINQVHESIMHLGFEKTLDKVYDFYRFDNMSKYVKNLLTTASLAKCLNQPQEKFRLNCIQSQK